MSYDASSAEPRKETAAPFTGMQRVAQDSAASDRGDEEGDDGYNGRKHRSY